MKINDRTVKSHIQLITQSNDCCLMNQYDLRSYEIDSQLFNGFVGFPRNSFYVREDGRINYKSLRSIKSKEDRQYIQIIDYLEISKDGEVQRDPYIFPDRLYLQFINLKNFDDLCKFVDRMGGFCFFPDKIHLAALSKLYQKAVGSDKFSFLFSNYSSVKEKEVTKIATKSLREINLKFLWFEKQRLEKMTVKYRNGKFGYDDMIEMNEKLKNVSLTFFHPQGYSFREKATEYFRMAFKNRPEGRWAWPSDEKENPKESALREATIAPAYRAYGHLAICFLEFYLDVEAGLQITTCKSCGELFRKKDKRQIYCRTDSCRKKQKKEQKRIERKRV